MGKLANKTAVITGGAGSIGLITAQEFLAEGAKKAREKSIPPGRYVQPDEVADLVVFLASDERKFINGTVNVIDGGSLVI